MFARDVRINSRKKRLRNAYDLMQRGESKEFYAAISSILRQYIGDKLNLPPAGITGEKFVRSSKIMDLMTKLHNV